MNVLAKAVAIGSQMGALISALPKDQVDVILDLIEDAIQRSESKLDDAVAFPLLQAVRLILDIPDDD